MQKPNLDINIKNIFNELLLNTVSNHFFSIPFQNIVFFLFHLRFIYYNSIWNFCFFHSISKKNFFINPVLNNYNFEYNFFWIFLNKVKNFVFLIQFYFVFLNEKTALSEAVELENIEIIKILLKHPSIDLNTQLVLNHDFFISFQKVIYFLFNFLKKV